MSEDTQVGKYTFKQGTSFIINMINIHHNPKEWIEPEKFIPERFDPESKYSLTPSGKKRHPMSFSPFLGGKRVCLGKTFADMVSRVIAPNILYNFDFEFVDKAHETSKPLNNVNLTYLPKIQAIAK
jgi:cytochrome P450